MHPYLFDFSIGPLRIALATYSVCALVGILVSGTIFIFSVEKRKNKLVAYILYLGVLMFVSFLGSRITQLLIDIYNRADEPVSFARLIASSGSNVAGGILIGAITVYIYARIDPHRIMTWHTIDVTAMAFPFGHMVGRLGCLSAGCCYGKICKDCVLTITYPRQWIIDAMTEEAIPHGPRIATPLIAAIGLFLIGITLFIILKITKGRGQLAPIYFILYGTFRFFHDFLRGDLESKGIFGPFSTGQWFGIISVITGTFLLAVFIHRYRMGVAGPPFLPVNGKEPTEKDAFG